jgi:hypothetical protein
MPVPSYYVLRGFERWNIYRAGRLAFSLTPRFAEIFLAELARYGCQINFGD